MGQVIYLPQKVLADSSECSRVRPPDLGKAYFQLKQNKLSTISQIQVKSMTIKKSNKKVYDFKLRLIIKYHTRLYSW